MLKEKLIKIGAKVVSKDRYVAVQKAEDTIPRVQYPAAGLGAAAATAGAST